MIKGKSPEEIRKTFNIKNDFTPAEEEQVNTFVNKQESTLRAQTSSNLSDNGNKIKTHA